MTETPLHENLSRHGSRPGDVSYISLALPDVSRGRAFYGTVLGWTFAPGEIEQDGSLVDEVIPQVGLWGGLQPSGRAVHGAVLGFRVDDVETAVALAREHGGTATDPHREPYGLAADCIDDQGLEFYLHQLPPPGQAAPMNGVRDGDISYVSLLVSDADRAREFYGAVLGWTFSPGPSGGTAVRAPTPMVGLTGEESGRPGALLSYRVSDIAAAVVRVRESGGTATEPEQRPYALEADCTDDQSTPFYLHQFAG